MNISEYLHLAFIAQGQKSTFWKQAPETSTRFRRNKKHPPSQKKKKRLRRIQAKSRAINFQK